MASQLHSKALIAMYFTDITDYHFICRLCPLAAQAQSDPQNVKSIESH